MDSQSTQSMFYYTYYMYILYICEELRRQRLICYAKYVKTHTLGITISPGNHKLYSQVTMYM